ncbi:hypothetical protein HK103_007678 [Boothiomyces macroporosus]|uniref:SET domain-containing protein n=1 Tax=Boothiomyces macroporosus TaxID=261099 RepID=A0AAD5Y1A7_9FUNG|nr:hypothetical protein HK103_007678 [Boothiomyces macroporosus]
MNEKIQKLYGWMKEQGIKSKITVKESYGLGLFANAKKGETVLSVPKNLIINRTNSLKFFEQSPLKFENFPFLLAPNSPEIQRFAILLYLTHLIYNPTPYSALLPREIKSPLGWDTQSVEFQLLASTGLDLAIKGKKAVLQEEYNVLEFRMGEEIYTLVEYLYLSRSMSLVENEEDKKKQEDWIGIIPVLDFCNHSFTPNANWEIKKDTVDLILLEDVDGEVFINYGPKPNNELLFIHGFILEDNECKLSSYAPLVEYPDDEVTIWEKGSIMTERGWGTRLQIGHYDPSHQDNLLPDVPVEIQVLLSGILDMRSLQILSLCALRKEDGLHKRGDKIYFKDKEENFKGRPVPYEKTKLIRFINGFFIHFLEELDQELEDSIEQTPNVKAVLYLRSQLVELLNFNVLILHEMFIKEDNSDEEGTSINPEEKVDAGDKDKLDLERLVEALDLKATETD